MQVQKFKWLANLTVEVISAGQISLFADGLTLFAVNRRVPHKASTTYFRVEVSSMPHARQRDRACQRGHSNVNSINEYKANTHHISMLPHMTHSTVEVHRKFTRLFASGALYVTPKMTKRQPRRTNPTNQVHNENVL